MSDFSLTLVLHFKTSKIINDMAKVQIKSEKIFLFFTFHFSLFVVPLQRVGCEKHERGAGQPAVSL